MILSERVCVPCTGAVPALAGAALSELQAQLPDWEVVGGHHLFRIFRYGDFQQALDFANRAGAVAESQGHHPDILVAWGRAEVTIYTHKIDGLTESDFILAARLDTVAAAPGLTDLSGQPEPQSL